MRVDMRGWCDAGCVGEEWTEAASTRSVSRNKISCAVSRRKAAVAARTVELRRVFVGFEREGEGVCAMCVSGEGIELAHHPSAEGQGIVDPIFRVIIFFFTRSRLTSRESIGSLVLVGGYVFELKVEKKDCRNPPVDGGIRLDIWVAEHTFNVACVHLNDEVADADEVKARCTEHAEEAIQLKFCLRVAGLAHVPRNGAEMRWAAATVRAILRENPTYATYGRVN